MSYLAELFRQLVCYLAELFRQIVCYLVELFRQIAFPYTLEIKIQERKANFIKNSSEKRVLSSTKGHVTLFGAMSITYSMQRFHDYTKDGLLSKIYLNWFVSVDPNS